MSGHKKTVKRNGHRCRSQDDADDAVKGQRVMGVKKSVYGSGEADDGEYGADRCGHKNRRTHTPQTIEKWCVKSKWHQKCRGAHARGNDAEGQTETAEKKTREAGRNLDGGCFKKAKKRKNRQHTHRQGEKAAFFIAVFCCLTEEGRDYAKNQSKKKADGGRGVTL